MEAHPTSSALGSTGSLALPSLFISHGSPMTALEPREAGQFMRELGPRWERVFGTPKAILAVSAHSLTREPVFLAAPQHHAVYDFGGFDPALYTLRYEPPGAPALAEQAALLLRRAQLPAHVLPEGGLDHGIWTPLRFIFPKAQVPVLPMAWPAAWSPARLVALGQALAPLAQQGVMVMATGSITHNLQRVFAGGMRNVDAPATQESTAFREWWREQAQAGQWGALCNYRSQAPHARLMHPSDEHLLPWFVAQGSARAGLDGVGNAGGHGATQAAEISELALPVKALRLHASLTYGELGMDTYALGEHAGQLCD